MRSECEGERVRWADGGGGGDAHGDDVAECAERLVDGGALAEAVAGGAAAVGALGARQVHQVDRTRLLHLARLRACRSARALTRAVTRAVTRASTQASTRVCSVIYERTSTCVLVHYPYICVLYA